MEQQMTLMSDRAFQMLDVEKSDLEYDKDKILKVLDDGASIDSLPIEIYQIHKDLLKQDLNKINIELTRVNEELGLLSGDNRVEAQIEASLWECDDDRETYPWEAEMLK